MVRYVSVAQLDRAIASDAMCRWFESSRVHHGSPRAKIARGLPWCIKRVKKEKTETKFAQVRPVACNGTK